MVITSKTKPGYALRVIRKHAMFKKDHMVVTVRPNQGPDEAIRSSISELSRAGWKVDLLAPAAKQPVELNPRTCQRFEMNVFLQLKDSVEGQLNLECTLPEGGKNHCRYRR